ncbi:MAG TPA: PhnD/SsuA/transferrin family substrate-binding protein [Rhodocyclaceae bacterium]
MVLALLGTRAGLAVPSPTLRLGALPVVSTRTAYEIYEPLVSHLESLLKQKVELETPPNFKAMYQRIHEKAFDVLVSPPHIARLAQQKLGWQPLAMCQPEHESVLMVMEADGPRMLEDLRGKTIAVLDRSALVVMIMMEALSKQGLVMDRDFKTIETRNYESSQIAVRQGIAQAMVIRSKGFIDSSERDRMKILFEAGALPGYVVIAAPTLDRNMVQLLRGDLPRFGSTPEAQGLLKKLGYEALAPATEQAMKRMDPYLSATEAVLK